MSRKKYLALALVAALGLSAVLVAKSYAVDPYGSTTNVTTPTTTTNVRPPVRDPLRPPTRSPFVP